MRRALTLIEFLVTVAILGIVIALLMPAIITAREAAREKGCSNNLRQLALAILNFESAAHRLPPGSTTSGGAALGYFVHVAPFLEEHRLFDLVDLQNQSCAAWIQGLRASGIENPAARSFATMACPSDPRAGTALESGPTGPAPGSLDVGRVFPANYLGVAGDTRSPGRLCPVLGIQNGSGLLFTNSKVRMRHIKDGQSKTMILGERGVPPSLTWGWVICGGTECDQYVATGISPLDRMTAGGVASNHQFWSWHYGGVNFAFADGSCRLVRSDVDAVSYPAMATRDSTLDNHFFKGLASFGR